MPGTMDALFGVFCFDRTTDICLYFVVSLYFRKFSQNIHLETLGFLSLCMLLVVRLALEFGGIERRT